MWLNGKQVHDGDLFRLEPGKHVLVCTVPLMGGYSAMQVKLREYTEADYQRDMSRYGEARRVYGGRGVLENDMERNLDLLTRSITRYIEVAVGKNGWGGWETHDTLLPFITTYQHLTGVDLSRDTGLKELTPLALRMNGHLRDRTFDFMVSQTAAFTPPAYQGMARWYLQEHSLGITRPIDAVVALATQKLDHAIESPQGVLPLAEVFPSHGVTTFNSGWRGSSDYFALLQAGTEPMSSRFGFGSWMLHGAGCTFAQPAFPDSYESYLTGNSVQVRRFCPTGSGRLVDTQRQPDGSGSSTVVMDQFRLVKVWEWKRFELDTRDPGIALQRTLAADYSGKAGVPAVTITIDKFSGTGKHEKVWQMRLGHISPETKEAEARGQSIYIDAAENRFVLRPNRDGPTLVGHVHAGQPVDYRTYNQSSDGVFTAMQIKLDREAGELELLQHEGVDDNLDDLGRATQDGGAAIDTATGGTPSPRAATPANPPGDKGKKAMPPLPMTGDDATVDNLLEDINHDLTKERMIQEKKLPPVYLVVVMTAQDQGKPAPAVAFEGKDDDLTIRVGGQTYHYDGVKVTW